MKYSAKVSPLLLSNKTITKQNLLYILAIEEKRIYSQPGNIHTKLQPILSASLCTLCFATNQSQQCWKFYAASNENNQYINPAYPKQSLHLYCPEKKLLNTRFKYFK